LGGESGGGGELFTAIQTTFSFKDEYGAAHFSYQI
jgi:hypothetical protein